jgi:hypothetical protein
MSVEFWHSMVNSENSSERIGATFNPNLPEELAIKLAKDEDRWVRYFLASNPKTNLNALKILLSDSNSTVKTAALNNPNVPKLLKIMT